MILKPIQTRLVRIFALGMTLALGAASNASEARQECENETTGQVEWSYCVSQVPGSKNSDRVYFLHGLLGSERSWESQADTYEQEWARLGKDAPTVVSISFGRIWLMSHASGSEVAGRHLEIFTKTAIPLLEKKLGVTGGRRFLYGRSMGGFNAAEVYLWHPELFSRVALICPALAEISPWASDEEVDQYIQRSGASSFLVHQAQRIAQENFTSEEKWALIAPLVAGKTQIKGSSPQLLVTIGQSDDYGFFEGTKQFAELAQKQRVPSVQWLPVSGGHCAGDDAAIAKFLVE